MKPLNVADEISLSPEIVEKINNLSPLQVRMLMAKAIANGEEKDISEVDLILRDQSKKWSEGENFTANDVVETLQCAYQYFDQLPALNPQSNFVNYVNSWIETQPALCKKIMESFCRSLCHVSLKSTEEQQIFFQYFPPSTEYLNCLEGTEERIKSLERIVASNEKYQPFLNAHDAVMMNNTDFVKNDVLPGNEIHVPKYLEYSLGLIGELTIHPQSQMPFWKAVVLQRNYEPDFKKFLIKELNEVVERRLEQIDLAVQNMSDVFDENGQVISGSSEDEDTAQKHFNPESFDPNNSQLLNQVNQNLQFLEGFQERSFVALNEDDTVAEINRMEAAHESLAIKFLEEFLRDELVAKLGPKNASSNYEFFDRPAKIFTAEARQKLFNILDIDPTKSVNEEEIIFAFETLWMVSEAYMSTPRRLASQVLADLENERNRDEYLDNVLWPIIGEIFPNHSRKLERVRNSFNPDFTVDLAIADNSFLRLVEQGANSDELVAKISSLDDAKEMQDQLSRGFYVAGENEIDEPEENYDSICRTLINRPDVAEIFDAITAKLAGAEIDQFFIVDCIHQALPSHNTQLIKDLFNRFPDVAVGALIDYKDSLLTDAVKFDDVETFSFFAEILKTNGRRTFLLRPYIQDNQQKTLMRMAVEQNSYRMIDALVNAVIDRENISVLDRGMWQGMPHVAAAGNCVESISALAKHGFNIFAQSSDGNTPIHLAAHNGHQDVLIRIAEIAQSQYHYSTNQVAELFNLPGRRSRTSAHYAVYSNKSGLVETVYNLGADLNLPDENGLLPLGAAIATRSKIALHELKKCGVDLVRDNPRGKTLFYRFVENRDVEMARFLVEDGFNPNYCSNQNEDRGFTAIHAAIENKQYDLIKVFAELGCDPEYPKAPPIIRACNNDDLAAVEALRDAGVDLNKVLLRWFGSGNLALLEENGPLLVDAGANPNFKIGDDYALHYLIEQRSRNINHNSSRSYAPMAAALANLGADLTVRNAAGLRADYLGMKSGMTAFSRVVPDENYDQIMREAIDRDDANFVSTIFFCSKTMATRDVIAKRGDEYLEYAKSKGNGPMIETIKNKLAEIKKSSVTTDAAVESDFSEDESVVSKNSADSAKRKSGASPEIPSYEPTNSQADRLLGNSIQSQKK